MLITIKDSINDQVDIQQMLSAIKVINWKSFTVNTCICSAMKLPESPFIINLIILDLKRNHNVT